VFIKVQFLPDVNEALIFEKKNSNMKYHKTK